MREKQVHNYTWKRLDNAAKIFPAAASGTDTQVFRFSCVLRDAVCEKNLQKALERTLSSFGVYRYVMKRGFFWYYLEECGAIPAVREEYKEPCGRLYDRNTGGFLFEVTYFGNRINLEVYHVLSDGTGAMRFLIALAASYISVHYGIREPYLEYDASQSQMAKDSFQKYSQKKSGGKSRFRRAYRLRGDTYPENRLKIITGTASAGEVLEEAHRWGATLSVYLCACMMEALQEEMPYRKRKRPLVIGVPVNLRQYFPSDSARNFFSMTFVSQDCSQGAADFQELLETAKESFRKNLTKENLSGAINGYMAVERNVAARVTPLFLKDICLHYAYRISEMRSTAAFSNIGRIDVPEEIAPYLESFDICTATDKLQLCTCTFGDCLSMSFTSPFISSDIEKHFFRRLTEAGISVTVASNDCGKEETPVDTPSEKVFSGSEDREKEAAE